MKYLYSLVLIIIAILLIKYIIKELKKNEPDFNGSNIQLAILIITL
jgi:hypothetical protein